MSGSHAEPGGQGHHESRSGATMSSIKHAFGRHEDESFKPAPTVRPEATIDGQPSQVTVAAGTENGVGNRPAAVPSPSGKTVVLCGPLINYRRSSQENTDNPIWHGTILLVTQPGQQPSSMALRIVRDNSHDEQVLTGAASYNNSIRPELLYEDVKGAFWRYKVEVHFQARESAWEYSIPNLEAAPKDKSKEPASSTGGVSPGESRVFYVPAKSESMRIMFHSCNGFSAGTDEAAWSGPALWNDVLRVHKQTPLHVMIGGGDQIYNDGIKVSGPLKPWTQISNPHKRGEFPFKEELRGQCDTWYFDNYVRWFSLSPFADVNGVVPQLNIWDDHDIIDGFGSYTNHFMRAPVFRGIGGVALKYYLLFQLHIAPPKSTFTTDAPQTQAAGHGGTAPADAIQLKQAWVMTNDPEDPSMIVGKSPGPYVEEKSRSIYCRLGDRMAFVGVDARTERTRHQINFPETYDLIFDRVQKELSAANGHIKHLILLLGVPIAYPRMIWLENILHSPIIGPLRFLNKRFGLAGGFFNSFDGQVELLDDLDDHWTARQHKAERKQLMHRLQDLSKSHSCRVTILSGDVHLGALGRFYSKPKLAIPAEQDHRFMINVVSSAITNKPPPQAVANLLARRNKIHHLDHDTDETLFNLFDKDPAEIASKEGVKSKAANSNHCTMPSRNYAIIREASTRPEEHLENSNGAAPHLEGGFKPDKNPRNALHVGELNGGNAHHAAVVQPVGNGAKSTNGNAPSTAAFDSDNAAGLDVTLRVEVDPSDPAGGTVGYGFSVPALRSAGRV